MTSTDELPEWDSDSYWSGQDFQQSARLHLQHWIWNYQLGYALHPKIDTTGPNPLRIADIGAGNAAWLLEVAQDLSSNKDVELVGFDITASNFPHAGYLPSNIKLHTWNAYSDLPSEHQGAFDIVHMRTMNSTIVNNKVDPLLSNALAMLKPGGYFQWDENDAINMKCNLPDSSVEAPSAETLVRLMSFVSKYQSKLLNDWLVNMPETLRERGCEVVAHEVNEAKKELARATTDNYLLVWKDVIRMVPETAMPLPPGMGLPESLSRKTFAELLQKCVEETGKGASLVMPFHVCVAQKSQ